MVQRAKKVIIIILILLGVGVVYTLIIRFTDFGIPCYFNIVTGLKCPGCGVTAMMLALLKLDFRAAFEANAVLLCLLPVFAVLAARFIYVYIKRGTVRDRAVEITAYILIALLVVWGVVRNLI